MMVCVIGAYAGSLDALLVGSDEWAQLTGLAQLTGGTAQLALQDFFANSWQRNPFGQLQVG